MPYQRGQTWFLRVPTKDGEVIRSSGSRDKATALLQEAMVVQLGGRGQRDWFLLGAVASGDLSLAELYEAFQGGRDELETLRARLRGEESDPNLEPYIEKWLTVVKLSSTADTTARYERYLRTLMPKGKVFRRSALTVDRMAAWLAALTYGVRQRDRKAERRMREQFAAAKARGEASGRCTVAPIYRVDQRPASSGTRRKYWAALSSFCSYLMRPTVGVLTEHLAGELDAPAQGEPRREHLSLARVKELVAAQPELYRTFSMLLHATGMEVSAALRANKRHFHFGDRSIRGLGTKWGTRDRITYIAAWAWPHISRYVAALGPDEPLFPELDRWRTLDAHKAACTKLGITNYTQHDARHSYAVHAVRCGASYEHVAEQLGHADTQMAIKVYARYSPSARERTAWEKRSAIIEREEQVAEARARAGARRRTSRSAPAQRSRRRRRHDE